MAKVVIVGGVAGGATAAARLRRLQESMEIVMFERGEYISFANCGLPYYLGGVIKDRQRLFQQTPARMKAEFNVDARIFSEVTGVDPVAKTIMVQSRDRGLYQESYDRLLLAPGAKPLKPAWPGVDHERIFTLRSVSDADNLKNWLSRSNSERAVIIGGGFIGLEMAENIKALGLEVVLIEAAPHVLAPLDSDLSVMVENELRSQGLELILNNEVKGFNHQAREVEVVLSGGQSRRADLVILAVGVVPDTDFLKNSGLEMGPKGHLIVDERMRTSQPDIYAVGDAVAVNNLLTGRPAPVPLAGPANRQARIAADNLAGGQAVYKGAQGTAIVKVFGLTAASTGLNERALREAGLAYETALIHPPAHADYYPGATPLAMKLLFDKNGRILGAQALGREGADKRIDVIGTVMRLNGRVHDLADLELCYAPPYSSAKDPVNLAGCVAENILAGIARPLSFEEYQALDQTEVITLDVRSPAEFDKGHLPGALNIPLDQLRQRVGELNRQKPVIVYCQVGRRSYLGARILTQLGFDARGLSGGYRSVMGRY